VVGVRSALNTWLLCGALALAGAACAPPAEDEASLVTDAEINSLQQDLVPPEQAPTQASSGKTFYVRLAWGFLAGKPAAQNWIDWTGSLSVDQGTVQLTHLTYFEKTDKPAAQTESDRISWTSRTKPHFDGLIARVEVPSDDATLTFDTPPFHHAFRATELTGGDDAVFPVDSAGHAVSVSSVPASACKGGFVLGYLRPARAGWMAFGGRSTDRTGQFNGRLRFRSLDDGTIKGRMLDDDGRETATVRGTLVREGEGGGSFSAELVDPGTGRTLGSITGIYTSPSYSARGSFQGTFEQVCEE
jgi:hypothetical protein